MPENSGRAAARPPGRALQFTTCYYQLTRPVALSTASAALTTTAADASSSVGTPPAVAATVTALTLNRATGTVTGALAAGPAAVGFEPEFVRTPKGFFWVNHVGGFAYHPFDSARRAAAHADAAFLGNHNDTLTVTAYDAAGSRMQVRAIIAILGS